jgi:hypothetical protein
MPVNKSLVALGAVGSPLTQDNLNIFFYGDSITWLGKYVGASVLWWGCWVVLGRWL